MEVNKLPLYFVRFGARDDNNNEGRVVTSSSFDEIAELFASTYENMKNPRIGKISNNSTNETGISIECVNPMVAWKRAYELKAVNTK